VAVAEVDWHQSRWASEIDGATYRACTFTDYFAAANMVHDGTSN
jgi:hypothetical protein